MASQQPGLYGLNPKIAIEKAVLDNSANSLTMISRRPRASCRNKLPRVEIRSCAIWFMAFGRLQVENMAACGTATESCETLEVFRLPDVIRNALRQLTRIGAASWLPKSLRSTRAVGKPGLTLPVVPRDRRIAMLQSVSTSLQDAGVAFRTQITESNAYCAVNSADLEAVCHALNRMAQSFESQPVRAWYGSGMDYEQGSDLVSLRCDDIGACESLIVGVPFELKSFQVARNGGAEILLLDQQGSRRLARRKRAAIVDWTSRFETEHPSRKSHESEPIDVVYTWVDSDDPVWAQSMREWASREDTVLESADNLQRYASRDELRYSLRSIWLYAPFVRRVFLVTAGQTPGWLHQDCDKLRLIRHEDIFPDPECLPTFNSHAIESCLHRIPDLAENFIYFNDDVFLNNETTVSSFFTRMGLIKSRFSQTAVVPASRPDASSTPTDWATYQSAELVEQDFGIRFDRKLKHTPMAMKRSVLAEIEDRYAESIALTRNARFRSETDVAMTSALAHFYGISVGKAVEWEHIPAEYCYVDTGRRDFESKLNGVPANDPTFICLNATRYFDVPSDRQSQVLDAYFEANYPMQSPFEKALKCAEGKQ